MAVDGNNSAFAFMQYSKTVKHLERRRSIELDAISEFRFHAEQPIWGNIFPSGIDASPRAFRLKPRSDIMTNSPKRFFDLHITGIGYVNRIRLVSIKRGNPFWACDIAALNGSADNVEYRRFDCRVNGAVAESLIKKLHTTVVDRKQRGMAEPNILINFKLGDLYADIFTRTKGERAGEQSVSMKARLLFINWVKIDNEKVYEAPKRSETSSNQNPAHPR